MSCPSDQVRKPLLYFVDYGLPSTERAATSSTCAHCRSSMVHSQSRTAADPHAPSMAFRAASRMRQEVPPLARSLPGGEPVPVPRQGGRPLIQLHRPPAQGSLRNFNDQALARGVVAHGAPYVTPSKAGRSEGCPAMEQERAQRLLPELADGGLVFSSRRFRSGWRTTLVAAASE